MKHIWYLMFIVALVACKPQKHTSFYFWKTTFALDTLSKDYLRQLNVQQLYVRFFDVDVVNGKPIPVAHIQLKEKDKTHEIIPVVFITNRTFLAVKDSSIAHLARHILNEISYMYPSISNQKIREIQFDCDWTASTRKNYFEFLKQCKSIKPTIIYSATIRMHQIKDVKEMGIPPVRKGVLMYYATSNPLDFDVQNSILDNVIAAKFLQNLQDYALHLDVAFAVYSWAILDNGYDDKKLLNGIRKEDLSDTTLFIPLKYNFYKVKKDTYWNGVYVYENYTIKLETVSAKELEIAAHNFSKKNRNMELNTIFYQLDSSNLVHYSIAQLKAISNP